MNIKQKSDKLTAGNIEDGAVDGRYPEVGGSCVEQHLESLSRRTDGDIPIVLSL